MAEASPDDYLTPFVGRERELARIAALLDEGTHLVTILGASGIGKSRLAREYSGDSGFIDVRHARGPDALRTAVAAALELAGDDTAIAAALAARGTAIVLDAVCAGAGALLLPGWLSEGASLVLTAREPLGVETEVLVDLDGLSAEDGRTLFQRRMARRAPGVMAEQLIIDALVESVHGIPLAIELVASRAGVLDSTQILERLAPCIEQAEGLRDRSTEPLSATLQGTIDWSWSLLDDHERVALARCSAVEGRFTATTAQELAGPEAGKLPVLYGLCAKALLRAETGATAGPVFEVHQSIRRYAGGQRVELG